MKRDLFIFGGLAGVIGNIPKEVITWLFYFAGLVTYTFDHFCAGIFILPPYIYTWPAMAVGFFADFTMSAVFGVLFLLTLRKIGIKYLTLKGIGFGSLLFVFCFGMLRPIVSPHLILASPLANLLYIIPHLLFGLTVCGFIKVQRLVEVNYEKDR